MTVSSTNTAENTIGELIRLSLITAGLMAIEEQPIGSQWEARVWFGRKQLDLIVDQLQAEGVITRDVQRYPLALSSGVASYALPGDTIDVHGQGMYKADASGSEFLIRQIDREEYHAITDKTTSGTPSRFWLERLATCTVYLHPVPDADGATLYLQRKAMLADASSGTNTVDLERYWHRYIQYALAFEFSTGSPAQERQILKSEADMAKERAQTYATQSTPTEMILDHRTGWSM